jgi:hypothetical protein
VKFLLAAFLAAHGLIHASYLAPAPPRTADGPEWPFEPARSWLVTGLGLDPGLARPLALALAVAIVVLLVGAGAATVGWLPVGWWPGLVVSGAACSMLMLALFFHPWLLLGIVIDLVLLWAALIAGWLPAAAADA